jgi:hypothetical protein
MLKIGKSLALIFFVMALYVAPAFAATSIPFTINMSKAVNVTGTPRIAIDVGGVTRYATYASGTGTSALTFNYAMVAGDVDLDGVTVSSPINLNGGTIKDLAGNDLSPLTFTPPNTTNVKVNDPSLGMDFIYDADGRFTLNGTVYNDFTSFLFAAGGTFSRSSIGTYFDSTGTLQTAASGVPRFDYDPVTHVAKGILIEESRTNYIKNSQFSGFPSATYTATQNFTNWQLNFPSALTGQSATVTPNSGNGISYLDVRMQGANSSGITKYMTFAPILTDSMPVSNGTQTIASAWFGVSSYTSTGGTCQAIFENRSMTSAGGYITSQTITLSSTSPYQKRIPAIITHGSTAAYAAAWIYIVIPNGATCDITMRLGAPQIEQGTFATSYIPTTTAAVTRAIDTISIPTGSWFSGATGTIIGRAEVPSLTQTDFGATLFNFNDNTAANYIWGFMRANGSGQTRGEVVTATASVGSFIGTNNFVINTPSTIGIAYQNSNFAFSAKGASLATSGAGNIPTVSKLIIGSREIGGSNRFNGNIAMIKYYPLRATNTQLQLLTQ